MSSKRRVVFFACLLALGMFAFGYALVPLYNLFCDITGLNGKVDNIAYTLQDSITVDTNRMVNMKFVVVKNEYMPWHFAATNNDVELHPGEMRTIEYFAHNMTDRDMVAQIIPSVSPGEAAEYVHKIECFCFDAQPLKAGESKQFVVNLLIDPDLPKHVQQVTLAYTVFDISETVR